MMKKIKDSVFCIVGCGAVGTAFAEMLVRSGAVFFSLIDQDTVDRSNLNRSIGFVDKDVGEHKTMALAGRLKQINPGISVKALPLSFMADNPDDPEAQKVRRVVEDSNFVLIATDNNQSRIWCEELLTAAANRRIHYLSVGIVVSPKYAQYECTWMPETPEEHKNNKGYGPENASYISIVMEAVAVAFNMMLYHLAHPASKKFTHIYREYKDYFPAKPEIDRHEQ